MLDSLIKHKGENIEAYEPVNKQYQLLKEKLLKAYQLAENGGWPSINLKEKKLQVGDTALAVVALKKRLHTVGDYSASDSSNIFTDTLSAAVKRFQGRYGLKEDGIVGGTTLQYLNEPIEVRIRQILVNMERMRWIPAEPTGDFILVNIPQYRLVVYEKGKRMFAMNIVAGSSQNQTVVFTGDLKYVVFSPYWNVPPSIIKKEILPGMKRNPNYLARHNMEWNGGKVRQKPGPNNSLGKVKFLFPNSYNIYLHDTPAKSLFDEPKRAFSHGCIRLADPRKLAIWALRNQPEWTEDKIDKAMNAGKEKYVTLKSTVPVFLGYFTAWVDEEGKLNFRDDIYGHDKKLAEHLFSKVE
jgi:murein L,D-transpeptidase YcbB/YkuD